MAETGRAAAAGGPEEGSCGREEEAEAPGGGGKVLGPSSHRSSSHRAWCSRDLSGLPSSGIQERSTTESSPWCLNVPSLSRQDTGILKAHWNKNEET